MINAVYIARHANERAEANEQNLFNQAIEHLRHRKESVRLGGIYTLYELAKGESTKEKYLASMRDILCAHIRSKTNEKEYKGISTKEPSLEIQISLDMLTKAIDLPDTAT